MENRPPEIPTNRDEFDPQLGQSKPESRRRPAINAEQLHHLGKEAVESDLEKTPELKPEDLDEVDFEKRKEVKDEPIKMPYVGELTPVGLILSDHPSANHETKTDSKDKEDDRTQDSQTEHLEASSARTIKSTTVIGASILAGVVIALVALIWIIK